MQRLKFFGNRQAAVEQAPTPAPPDDGVVIEIKATALCGTDLHSLYRKPEESPCTPGHEFAGTVAETGKSSRFRKGDRITIYCAPGCGQCWFCKVGAAIACPVDRTYIGFQRDGGDAEFAAVPDRACFILPDDISFEDGALIGDGVASIHHGLKKVGGVREGDTVGVFGVATALPGGPGRHAECDAAALFPWRGTVGNDRDDAPAGHPARQGDRRAGLETSGCRRPQIVAPVTSCP